jgi:hypothetical protein
MIKPAFIIFVSLTIIHLSCKKEYSYEGGPAATVIIDSGAVNTPKPYICPSCIGTDNFIDGKWSFYNGNDFYCGIIDTAISTPARNAFTFFGPSSCSADSGLVLTINTEPALLNQDVFNSTTTKVGMYYYDHVAHSYPFMTQPGYQFSVTIESYINQTRVMTGRFSGTVFKAGGGQTSLQGKFKIKIL